MPKIRTFYPCIFNVLYFGSLEVRNYGSKGPKQKGHILVIFFMLVDHFTKMWNSLSLGIPHLMCSIELDYFN